MLNKLILRTSAVNWPVSRLSRVLRAAHYTERTLQSLVAASALLVIVQLAWPAQRVRPLARVAGKPVGLLSANDLQANLKELSAQAYVLKTSQQSYRLQPATLGIAIDTTKSSQQILSYKWWQRLVPLSLFIHHNPSVQARINPDKLQKELTAFAVVRNQAPVDASIQRTNNIYDQDTVVPGKQGRAVNLPPLIDEVKKAIPGSTIIVPEISVEPKITLAQLQTTIASWQQQTSKTLSLTVGSGSISIDPSLLQKWVSIAPNQTHTATLTTYDTAAIKQWLVDNAADRFYVAPKAATAHLLDNAVTSSTAGSNGQALDPTNTAGAIAAALQKGQHQATPVIVAVAYKTNQTLQYSPTSRGLQLLLQHWKQQYPKMSAAASFLEVGGEQRSANLNSNTSFSTASVYKLFVADYIFHMAESGQLNLDSPVAITGQTIGSCLEKMIVVSDNNCPLAFGSQFGWSAEGNFVQQQGFNGTSLVNTTSTTGDVTKLLSQLYAGQLMNSGNTATLLGYMGRQIYRSAIPAGSPGCTVYDKVGFYGGYWHDAAIVKSQHATYILVVFTKNGGAAAIKDLANQIHQTIDISNT